MPYTHTSRRGDLHTETEQFPERDLALSILQIAVSDLRAGKPGIRLWFEISPMMEFWAQAAGIDPDVLRARALSDVIGRPGQRYRSGKYKTRSTKPRSKPKPEPEPWREPEQLAMSLGG